MYRIVRGDSGFAYKELYYLCETLDTQYVIRLKANPNLYRKAAEVTELVMREENIQYSQQVLGEFEYQAKSWDKPRRVIVQIRRKAGELYQNHLFIVTNMKSNLNRWSHFMPNVERWRTTMENYIKECKNGFKMDKVSHKSYIANLNRIQQTVLAYNIINGFRRLTLPKGYRQVMIEILRIKLFKVVAQKVKKARQVIFKLCSHYPYQKIFNEALKNIQELQLK